MKAVIIEDEKLTAEDLRNTLEGLDQDVQVVKVLSSVREAVAYFRSAPGPDLIFSDIELGDGKCFEIFRQVALQVPVIFSTAYDHYALEAFRHNGIDYVLKPFRKDDLQRAVGKWNGLKQVMGPDMKGLLESLSSLQRDKEEVAGSVLVTWKDRIIPLKTSDIAYFCLDAGNTFVVTMDNRRFSVPETLDEFVKRCGAGFFRVNRQYLVNRAAVIEAVHHTHRKLLVRVRPDIDTEITLAKARIPEFLQWLQAR